MNRLENIRWLIFGRSEDRRMEWQCYVMSDATLLHVLASGQRVLALKNCCNTRGLRFVLLWLSARCCIQLVLLMLLSLPLSISPQTLSLADTLMRRVLFREVLMLMHCHQRFQTWLPHSRAWFRRPQPLCILTKKWWTRMATEFANVYNKSMYASGGATGWTIVGRWLDNASPMVAQWLAECWPMAHQWWTNGWPMVGHMCFVTEMWLYNHIMRLYNHIDVIIRAPKCAWFANRRAVVGQYLENSWPKLT